MKLSRRTLLKGLLGASAALPATLALPRLVRGNGLGRARRLIVFYFPDGIAGRSQDGDPSLWPARQMGSEVVLSELLQPLEALKSQCVFLNGLSMGSTDEGSHPGGAKKLLTGRDGGNGESIDQFVARTVGSSSPFHHLYLGAQAAQNNASGDKFISYPSAGVTVPPEDDPVRAFRRVFGMGTPTGTMMPTTPTDTGDRSVLDTALADLNDLRAGLGTAERVKLDLHLEALREVESRLTAMPAMMMSAPASCAMPRLSFTELSNTALYAPENFPAILRAQTDLMVTAMACGLTKVGTIQCSQHTSELIMSRFMATPMYDAGFDMRSHQASHYGAHHDLSNRLYSDFVKQVKWWVAQFAYLVEQLRARPEDGGTMLDHSVVLLCSEVSDGNTHSHQDMPFVLAGSAGGCIQTGRVIENSGRRHGDLLATLAAAMGQDVRGYGDASTGRIPGLLA